MTENTLHFIDYNADCVRPYSGRADLVERYERVSEAAGHPLFGVFEFKEDMLEEALKVDAIARHGVAPFDPLSDEEMYEKIDKMLRIIDSRNAEVSTGDSEGPIANSDDQKFPIAKLELSPGDLLAVRMEEIASHARIEEVAKCFKKIVPKGVGVIVVNHNVGLSVIKRGEVI